MEWQEAVRESFRPGVAESTDAKCTEAVLNAMQKRKDKWVKFTRLAQNHDWYKKFGSSVLGRTKDALVKQCVLVEEGTEDGDGKKRKTGRVRLADDAD
jgi:hypothetical protein